MRTASLIALMVAWSVLLLADTQEAPVPNPPPSKWDKHLLQLDREALDDAYNRQLRFLFTVWMKDEHGQPQRAMNGARQARHAYIAVMSEIERRERETDR